ncbi:MAG: ATP-grasp domain-containing protein [Dehalococcoidales bacterium]|nr:MAG: ATP-grasp domain-containing protein [Dehalococcoidales bacterium]
MQIGLAYDIKSSITAHSTVEDALEEYDLPETLDTIESALLKRGHKVVRLGGGSEFLHAICHTQVDIVFNIAEGRGNHRSREAQVPAVLEMLGIPYTGSDPLCLALCLDKPIVKKLLKAEGIPTPRWFTIGSEEGVPEARWDVFPFPKIIKPSCEGSSKGIRRTSVVHNVREAEEETIRIIQDYRQPGMVEEFIDGDEVTVGIIGNNPPEVVGMMRILPKMKVRNFVYSLEVKRDYTNQVDYESPVKLPDPVLDKLESASLAIFKTLGCRDFARIDFRISRDGTPQFIEINPLPGLGTYSDLVIMAVKLGWTHEGLINAVLDAALERYPQCVSV